MKLGMNVAYFAALDIYTETPHRSLYGREAEALLSESMLMEADRERSLAHHARKEARRYVDVARRLSWLSGKAVAKRRVA